MKKLGLLVKEISQKQIKDNLKESESLFVVNYSRLSSPDLSSLRQSLKRVDAFLFVVKNSVARRAFKDLDLESLVKTIEGPTGLVFIKEDAVGASRVLCDFVRGHEALKLQGGCLKNRILERKDIEALAKLPTKEVLRAQVVMTLNSPILKFALALNNTLKKIVWCLDRIKNKKGG